jgi:hypothetical protein
MIQKIVLFLFYLCIAKAKSSLELYISDLIRSDFVIIMTYDLLKNLI